MKKNVLKVIKQKLAKHAQSNKTPERKRNFIFCTGIFIVYNVHATTEWWMKKKKRKKREDHRNFNKNLGEIFLETVQFQNVTTGWLM